MTHPFDLKLSDLKLIDLEFEDSVAAEGVVLAGGLSIPVDNPHPIDPYPRCPLPRPLPKPYPKPIPICPPYPKPPIDVTTLAIGEEGGDLMD